MRFVRVPLTVSGIPIGFADVRDDGIIDFECHSEVVENFELRKEITDRILEAVDRDLCIGLSIRPTPSSKMYGIMGMDENYPVPPLTVLRNRDALSHTHHHFVD